MGQDRSRSVIYYSDIKRYLKGELINSPFNIKDRSFVPEREKK